MPHDSGIRQVGNQPNRLTIVEGRPVGEVLARVRSGDQAAFSGLYRALYPLLWRVALVLTRSAEMAEEVLQDVFCTLWTRRAALDTDMDIRVYLAAAVRNRAHDLGRHQTVITAVEHAVEHHTLEAPAIATQLQAPDVALETQEFHAAYHRALTLLSHRERVALLLRWEEELTFEQIGQALGVSTVGARAVVLRGQRKVQQTLAEYRG